MPLSETRLRDKFLVVIEQMQQETDNPNDSKMEFATKFAKAIVEEIKEAKINYTSGLIAPNGAVTGTINHTIS